MVLREKNRNNMKSVLLWLPVEVIAEVDALQNALWEHNQTSRTGVIRSCLLTGMDRLKTDIARINKIRQEEAVS